MIRFDNRPFADVEEMHRELVRRWNERVAPEDTVYILGDFIWKKENLWPEIVRQFQGNKVLLRGNHDPRGFSKETRDLFQDVRDYKEIMDSGRRVILCHYPILFYKKDYHKNTYMICGHVHTTRENEYLELIRKKMRSDESCVSLGQVYNVGCMMPYMNYTPRTLDEIINTVI